MKNKQLLLFLCDYCRAESERAGFVDSFCKQCQGQLPKYEKLLKEHKQES